MPESKLCACAGLPLDAAAYRNIRPTDVENATNHECVVIRIEPTKVEGIPTRRGSDTSLLVERAGCRCKRIEFGDQRTRIGNYCSTKCFNSVYANILVAGIEDNLKVSVDEAQARPGRGQTIVVVPWISTVSHILLAACNSAALNRECARQIIVTGAVLASEMEDIVAIHEHNGRWTDRNACRGGLGGICNIPRLPLLHRQPRSLSRQPPWWSPCRWKWDWPRSCRTQSFRT